MRALEKGVAKGFEGVETQGAAEVDAAAEMERAKREVKEIEEKKALTQGGQHAQVAPKMNIKVRVGCRVPCAGEADWAWSVGCGYERTGEIKASAVDTPHRGVPEPGGVGGEDRAGSQKQERGRQQVW